MAPNALLRVAEVIDRAADRIGRVIAWLTLAMVLIGAFNAIARYSGRFLGVNLSSNAYIELQWYLFSVVFLLTASYALRHGAHVRVDVFYNRFSEKTQAWIDLAGTALMLVPFSIFIMIVSWPSIRNSWQIGETSPDPGGLPRYPLKALILVCFTMLLVQAVSEIAKAIARLRGLTPPGADSGGSGPGSDGPGVHPGGPGAQSGGPGAERGDETGKGGSGDRARPPIPAEGI